MKILLLTVFTVILLSCATQRLYEKSNTKPTNEPQNSSINLASRTSCPSKEFFSFLRRFMNDIDIQKKFTKYPLLISYNDFDGLETHKITNVFSEEEHGYPMLSNDYKRLVLNHEIAIGFIEYDLVKVTEYIPHADNPIIDYYFYYKENECWKLIAIEDRSV